MPRNNHDAAVFDEFIRSAAHIIIYLVLGLLVINTIIVQYKYYKKHSCKMLIEDQPRKASVITRKKLYTLMGLALLICFVYAISDEIHQTFVPGRGAQISDVVLDSLGAGTGIIVYLQLGMWVVS